MTKLTLSQRGFRLCMGGLQAISLCWLLGSIILYGVHLAYSPDDSDTSRWQRSGFVIRVDHKTGLEYLDSGSCFMPRLDKDGNQMREGK
jgi:hypothetical protein